MKFVKLPSNSKKLLDEIVFSDNPVQMLSERFDKSSSRENDELRGMLRELREAGYIYISWANNKPYRVTINNSARNYDELLSEYEIKSEKMQNPIYHIQNTNDHSVRIGDGNKITNSVIAGTNYGSSEKKSFCERHPVWTAIVSGIIVGFVLMFSFWSKLIQWIERLF